MTTMEFQPPYFPPPFGGGGGVSHSGGGGGQDVFGQHISASTDPYQHYAVKNFNIIILNKKQAIRVLFKYL